MKFWKILSSLIEETLPDWQDKFLSYKALKKQLKLIYPKQELIHDDHNTYSSNNDDCVRPSKRLRLEVYDDKGGDYEVSKEVTDFVKLLEEEIDKFNAFFVDKEEEYIIRLKVLQDRLEEADGSNGDLMNVGRQIVDFHGEMVLLENYSALNYTGLVKILKKYDKLSGALIRLPFIQKVLGQPFFRIDVLNQLVKQCERMLDYVFSLSEISSQSEAIESCETNTATETEERSLKVPQELAEIEYMENMYMKLASSALRVLKEIRSGSSTVNMFSLPPL
ncbi:SPX domain-containing protein 2 [Coffea arabica]|uniref:SPX domain-containing protein 2 n=1 Tax=Coffea arabica TaxID=13443 RepID=A0A6P6U5J8_COFAR